MIVLPAPARRVRHGAAGGLAELTVLRHRDLGLVNPVAVEIDLVFGLFVGAADPEFVPMVNSPAGTKTTSARSLAFMYRLPSSTTYGASRVAVLMQRLVGLVLFTRTAN